MASIAKTIVATGASSGLGFEVIKHLLAQPQPYKFILGVRDVPTTQAAYNRVQYDKSQHTLTLLPLELSDLRTVKTFAGQVLKKLGEGEGGGNAPSEGIDYLMLNAARSHAAEGLGPNGSKWCETYVVNHLSQHYLVHLLRDKLAASASRLVFVSSGAVNMVKDPSTLSTILLANSGAAPMTVYPASKLAALYGAHWWRRELTGKCTVVAVSPGLIPDTGLSRGMPDAMSKNNLPPEVMKDAKSVSEGECISRSMNTNSVTSSFGSPNRVFLVHSPSTTLPISTAQMKRRSPVHSP
ncbi:NAD(P)-binding protein [Favolaschia claudopus]|uniref:NAD(P)-binding protein n=1 Tax=Favolaschia claudopus TaxID=2862362 RepID=A0AAW0A0G5_9AGAR